MNSSVEKEKDFITYLAFRIARGTRESLTIVVIALLFSVFANWIRSDGLSWRADWSAQSIARQQLQELQTIPLARAWELFADGRALFLDARDPGSYMLGHLPGALNVPPEQADSFVEEIKAMVDSGMVPIAYCDGANCPLSPKLAEALQEMGVQGVKILVNGWSAWKTAGYPVEGPGQ